MEEKTGATAETGAVKTGHEAEMQGFPELALFLAQSYGQLLKDREYLKSVIDAGVQPYTEEMAIRDLSSVSIDYEFEHVQTSNIARVPERIVELLDSGYVEKMNRRLRREMDDTVKQYSYVCWKADILETAMRERMDKMERAIFERLYIQGKTYKQICKAYKKGTLHDNQLNEMRKRCIQAVAEHLKNISCFPLYSRYMMELQREFREVKESEG